MRGEASKTLGISGGQARNQITSLLRQAWDFRARELGLSVFQTATNTNAWYLPLGLVNDDIVQFIGPEGRRIRKNLVGRSEKRQVFWHFAVEAVPVVRGVGRFTLRPHVIFSEDGKTPLKSAARMHALRRGFCKTWWNDRWRDLIAAFAAWMAQERGPLTFL